MDVLNAPPAAAAAVGGTSKLHAAAAGAAVGSATGLHAPAVAAAPVPEDRNGCCTASGIRDADAAACGGWAVEVAKVPDADAGAGVAAPGLHPPAAAVTRGPVGARGGLGAAVAIDSAAAGTIAAVDVARAVVVAAGAELRAVLGKSRTG